MSLINAMSGLLAEAEEPIPLYIQYGYAFHALRSMLGRSKYDDAEEKIVLDIYRSEAAQAGQAAIQRRAEHEHDQPRIRAHFLQDVQTVLDNLLPDGSCRIATRSGFVWTTSPTKIAAELNVLPSAVRQAQTQLASLKKTG